ncbi:unnamed protein product, partial [Enterobius vermicularis]|uniref:ENTH domain-containing protein n=1 Tax=Enterobius vermicularis TaxID=51028 RepID=A0A0N4UTK4_ENTVE
MIDQTAIMMILHDNFSKITALEIMLAKLNTQDNWSSQQLISLLHQASKARECVGITFALRYVRKDELKTASASYERDCSNPNYLSGGRTNEDK